MKKSFVGFLACFLVSYGASCNDTPSAGSYTIRWHLTHSPPLSDAIRLVTFNAFGLPGFGPFSVSPYRSERMAGICRELEAQSSQPDGWDVILMQEVWVPSNRRSLRNCGYPYAVDENDPGRFLDSGLLILSRYPLEKVARLTYPTNGTLARLFVDGEILARKSAVMARIRHPVLGDLWVANTHLVAEYPDGADAYLENRKAQLRQYAAWARARAGADPLILGGDLNLGPKSPLWPEIAKDLPGFQEDPQAAVSCTCCPPNHFKTVDDGKIDHLFGSPAWVPIRGRIAMTSEIKMGTEPMSLSDHYAWETTFRLRFPPRTTPLPDERFHYNAGRRTPFSALLALAPLMLR